MRYFVTGPMTVLVVLTLGVLLSVAVFLFRRPAHEPDAGPVCPRCGQRIVTVAKFCGHCGQALHRTPHKKGEP